MNLSRFIFLAGPTAVGKSAISFHLAQQLQGEIVSVDSMQVYRGLDIGTAKPTVAEREVVPHHLVDVVNVTDPFDAATWVRMAKDAVARIEGRGRQVIFCGGTGLYFKAFLEGLGASPRPDPTLRAKLERTALQELLSELQEKDPTTFERIDRQNTRRVIRAVEVIRLTSRPYSEQRSVWHRKDEREPRHEGGISFVGLERNGEQLRRRIEERVDKMFELGLVAETERLLARGLARNRTAMQAIGYRQTVEYLRGERSLQETVALVKRRTWQFARRQLTWFRRQMNLEWIPVGDRENAETVAVRLAGMALERR